MIVGRIGADRQFAVAESAGDGPAGESHDPVVGVPEPAGRGGVGGQTEGEVPPFPLAPSGSGLLQDLEGFAGGERVGEMTPVDEVDEGLGFEVDEDLPHRFADDTCVQVPEGVHEGGGGQVDDALLGSEPAELGIAGEGAGERAEAFGQIVDVDVDEVVGECVDGGDADLVAAADREREPMTLMITVRLEDDVSGRVVGIRMHGVGAGEIDGGREPQIMGADPGDPHGAVTRCRCVPSPSIPSSTTEPARR